ncbi:hypothetical protein [Paenibacillus sp. HJGM_3]
MLQYLKDWIVDVGWIIVGLLMFVAMMLFTDIFTGIGDKVFKKSNDD